jgi:hypothetical protein
VGKSNIFYTHCWELMTTVGKSWLLITVLAMMEGDGLTLGEQLSFSLSHKVMTSDFFWVKFCNLATKQRPL